MAPHTQNTHHEVEVPAVDHSLYFTCWAITWWELSTLVFTHPKRPHTHILCACLFEWCFVEGMSGPLCAAPACAHYPQRQREGCQDARDPSRSHTHARTRTSTHTPQPSRGSACHQASELHGLCWSSRGHSGVLRGPQTCVGVCVWVRNAWTLTACTQQVMTPLPAQ